MDGGREALKTKRLPGRPNKLEATEFRGAYRAVTGRSPLQLGFPFALSMRSMFARLSIKRTGVRLSPVLVGRLLANLEKYVETLGGRLKFLFLPPYSPELYPDELVWNRVKNKAVGRSKLDGPREQCCAVVGRLHFLQKRPDRFRSFFHALETAYAASRLKVIRYWLGRRALSCIDDAATGSSEARSP